MEASGAASDDDGSSSISNVLAQYMSGPSSEVVCIYKQRVI